jgi:hypothetical protein
VTIKDVVDDLFGIPHKREVPTVAYPETAQDGGKPQTSPNMDPHYFQPEYPQLKAVQEIPAVTHPDSEWLGATRQGKFIPYIGNVDHGLEINVDPSAIPVNDIDLIRARGHAYGSPVGAPHTPPVPVVIIDTPSFFGIEKKFSTNFFTLVTGVPTLIASRRPERTLLRLSVSAAVSIGQTIEQVNVGFVLPANAVFTMNVNQPVYAIAATGTPTVSVYEEFTVVEGQKRF